MWWWRSMSLSQYYGAIASVLSRLNKDWSSHLLVFYHHMFFISWSQLGGLNYLSPILNTFLYNLFCYQESPIYVDFIGYKGFGKRFKVQTGNLSKWNNKKISLKRDRKRYIQNISTTFFQVMCTCRIWVFCWRITYWKASTRQPQICIRSYIGEY